MSRQAIFVLGPHRAGTSAVAGLLVRLGVRPPRTLMPANADNPLGYWESLAACEFHDRLLRAAGSRWDDFTPLELSHLPSDTVAALDGECRRVLRNEFEDAPSFVIKDPRVCRFVPFWLRVLAGEHVSAAGVLVLRSPGEVVRSLATRNGFGPELSLLIWLRHTLDAERHTRGIRRTFVRYRDLLDRWQAVAHRLSEDLDLVAAGGSAISDTDVAGFLNPSLCHYPIALDVPDVPPLVSNWTQKAWTALTSLAHADRGRHAEVLRALDDVRRELDEHTSVGGLVDRMHRELRTRIEDLERKHQVLREQAEALEQDRQAIHRHSATVERQRDELQGRVAALEQRVDALLGSASWRVTAPLRAVYRIFR